MDIPVVITNEEEQKKALDIQAEIVKEMSAKSTFTFHVSYFEVMVLSFMKETVDEEKISPFL
jgi:hypothetical protein